MSETPEERRGRLEAVIYDTIRQVAEDGDAIGPEVLVAICDALEPPVADMVRRGVEEEYDTAYGPNPEHRWYRPRSEP